MRKFGFLFNGPWHVEEGWALLFMVPAEQQPGGGVGAAGAEEASHRDQILHVHSCSARSTQVIQLLIY